MMDLLHRNHGCHKAQVQKVYEKNVTHSTVTGHSIHTLQTTCRRSLCGPGITTGAEEGECKELRQDFSF